MVQNLQLLREKVRIWTPVPLLLYQHVAYTFLLLCACLCLLFQECFSHDLCILKSYLSTRLSSHIPSSRTVWDLPNILSPFFTHVYLWDTQIIFYYNNIIIIQYILIYLYNYIIVRYTHVILWDTIFCSNLCYNIEQIFPRLELFYICISLGTIIHPALYSFMKQLLGLTKCKTLMHLGVN